MGSADLPLELPARYRPLRHLANGGMAAVWVVRDTLLDRDVAVKVLSPALAADDDARTRFTREARAAARLSGHPHVVTVYDAGEHDGQAYLVMALYAGGTVADRLRDDGLPATATALRWLREAADGLDAAHAADVVHRDVKPANLLLDERDRVAVGDFGIAKAAWNASVTQTGLVVGTAAYLAPEQRTGGTATAATDRYALGVVAHQLLTGTRPPDGQLDPSLPGPVKAALAQALAPVPEDRPPSARALVADLERALDADDGDEATTVMAARGRPRPRAPLPVPVPAPDLDPDTDDGATAAWDVEPTAPRVVAAREPRPPRRGAGTPAAPPPDPPARAGGGSRARTLVPVAAVLLALGTGAAVLASGGEEADGGAGATTEQRADTTAEPTPTPEPTATPTPEPTATATPQPTPTAEAPAPGEDPKALNDAGFALFNQGRYAEALPLLERALAGLQSTPQDQYYAFALYNLGATLRRLGRPAEAIPYLERRLQVSDFKRGVVEQELAAARNEAGGGPGASGQPQQGPKGRGRGRGPRDAGDVLDFFLDGDD
ncbi:serine/threonine-protein kinase [Paraconexibacter algicola]|uniref:non-specific serine/threonine protein kinase n=1 Tax=Paraconexibacter algicola TaxID=2133960 RepID=A0A2T4UD51_9ACTN|nr:serine/threonine-protein kinase [Paraconexibacter algicola]PTL55423.1 hypothetical protein C7Y72_17340 [Paraconexibacter algicola]